MGSELLDDKTAVTDADKYQPETQTIKGTTDQKLNDLVAKDGIKDLIELDGSKTTDLSSISSVAWYSSNDDANEWNKKMLDQDGNSLAQPAQLVTWILRISLHGQRQLTKMVQLTL